MNIGILGTGTVGKTLATSFLAQGHGVTMGSRSVEGGAEWAGAAGPGARHGTFAQAAGVAEIAVLAVGGGVALDAVKQAGGDAAFAGKIVIDVTNPLDFSRGFPPTLIEGMHNTSSLGERIQAELPSAHVVKCWNTMSAAIMTAPGKLSEATDVFVAGNDAEAKARVTGLLRAFGWETPIDLGGMEAARGLEAWLLFWTRAMGPMGGNGLFNLKLVTA